MAQKWEDAKTLIPGEGASSLDYVNFHWYGNDPGALRESIEYLKRATGKRAVTTEIGQWDSGAQANADQVTSELGVLTDEQLPYALWFDNDGDPRSACTTTTGRCATAALPSPPSPPPTPSTDPGNQSVLAGLSDG